MNVAKNPLRHWDEGRLETRKWQDKEGKDRYTTEIIANEMKVLGSRSGQGDVSGRERGGEARERAQAPAGEGRSAAKKPAGQFSDMDDDIPL
jgi:single-strand DNA-binding protein